MSVPVVTAARAAEETVREAILCPRHRQRDCSPLLNGCSLPNEAHAALAVLVDRTEQAERERDELIRLGQEALESSRRVLAAFGASYRVGHASGVAVEEARATLRVLANATGFNGTVGQAEWRAALAAAGVPDRKAAQS